MSKNDKEPKVAIVHDYLTQRGGDQKVLETLLEIYPTAPVYTGIYYPEHVSPEIAAHDIRAPKSGVLHRFSKYLTFLMPFIFEGFDLSEFDIIISTSHAWAKGVLTKPDQLHISYMFSPPRFLYGYSVESQKRNVWYFKPIVGVLDFLLRIWDFHAAQRPNHMLVISQEVQKRVKKFYGRDAEVLYPPVEIESAVKTTENPLDLPENAPTGQYYVVISRMAAYKNVDLVIKAFSLLENDGFDKQLVIIGTGKEENRLKALAGGLVSFVGRVPESEKHAFLEHCLGVINPVQDEDFGIVPVEAMSHGKPVLAHASGGHLETVQDGMTGMLFNSTEVGDFTKIITKFDEMIANKTFNSIKIKESVQIYDKSLFKEKFAKYVADRWVAVDQATKSL